MSAPSVIPETTLPDTSSEAREREQRPVVLVRATQESPVTVRVEDEVHDIRDEVRRLATRFDGMEERFDGLENRMDESDRKMQVQFDHIKKWCEEVAGTLGQMMGQLTDINRRVGPAPQ